MKRLNGIILLLFSIWLSGCLSTLYPIFTEKDVEFNPIMLGNWKDKDGNIVSIRKGTRADLSVFPDKLQKLADRSYIVSSFTDERNEEARFLVFMVSLGKNHYLDYYPIATEKSRKDPRYYTGHWIGMHSIYRIQFEGAAAFDLTQFKKSYLDELIRKKQIRIRHDSEYGGDFVITAPTSELQQYILKYGDVPEAYEDRKPYSKIN